MDNLLEEEQERILASLSQVLPGSSSEETLLNPEDVEKVKEKGGAAESGHKEGRRCVKRSIPRKKNKNICPFTATKKKRRSKKLRIAKKTPGAGREENDSGFGTPSEVKYAGPAVEGNQLSDSEDSVTSLESVSLLEIARRTGLRSENVPAGMNLAWNVKVFPALDDDEEEEAKSTSDKAVQTVYAPNQADGSIMPTANFVSSVIKLKQALSSKANISRKEFEKILKRLPEMDQPEYEPEGSSDSDEMEIPGGDGTPFMAAKRRKDTVSCETVRYVMRMTNAEDIAEKSVDAILIWLDKETKRNWRTVCYYWCGSMSADVVDVINEAVDSDVIGIRKKVSDFLAGIFNEIYEEGAEDTVQELKVAFLSNFCKSILLQYDLINHVNKKLSVVSSDWLNIQYEITTAKKTYFTLRLLQDLLQSFLRELNTHRNEEIFRVRPKHANLGVLNMWKANWRRDDVVSDDISHVHSKYFKVTRGWCDHMDAILNFSLKECPLLSLVAQKCSSLVREILSKMQTFTNDNSA